MTPRRTVLRLLLALLLVAGFAHVVSAAESPVPRTILALYDSRFVKRWYDTNIPQMAEMPLNYLGLVVRHVDIAKGLPDPDTLPDVRGVITWFAFNGMQDPRAYLAWAEKMVAAGKKFVIIGDPGFLQDGAGHDVPLATVNQFMAMLGLRVEDNYIRFTYDADILKKDTSMVGFERKLKGVLPPFDVIRPIDSQVTSFLVMERKGLPETKSHLVTVGPHGGMVAEGYAVHFEPDGVHRQWLLNPFEYFRRAFGTDDLPKPDVTTLFGRRIFFSHIDGDGFRNVSWVPPYRQEHKLSAEVILDQILEKNPDLPVTIGMIAADIDPAWCGTPETMALARHILALPQVEAGTHTYSHPLDWDFFADGNLDKKERPFLPYYPGCGTDSGPTRLAALWNFIRGDKALSKPVILEGSTKLDLKSNSDASVSGIATPRSYANHPFNLDNEIKGSAEFFDKLAPPGKKVRIIQWSGNCLPFEKALAEAAHVGLQNINGGDTRFDADFPTVAWVAPIGRQIGPYWQIYAADSNENLYTDLWSDRYFGFRYLTATLANTEQPRRLKPIDLYYHFYSGEKEASLAGLKDNIAYIRKQEIIPIHTSEYAAIATGFYTTRIVTLGVHEWRIEDRGALQTIRFGSVDATLGVDFSRSSGVLGARRYRDSLYVALDPTDKAPIVALNAVPVAPGDGRSYLIDSNWQIHRMRVDKNGITLDASGFGAGVVQLQVQPGAKYQLRVSAGAAPASAKGVVADADGVLTIPLGASNSEAHAVLEQAE
ncbi:MAG: polysaccharide deacetylase family protein [Stellaceae bacterium]